TATVSDGTTTRKPVESVLPELRTMWWETGIRARAEAGLFAVVAQLPRLIGTASRIAWKADRLRTAIVCATTIGSGMMAAVGLLATQSVLIQIFAGEPTPARLRSALPSLVVLAVVIAIRGSLGIATGYAQNGLTPRVERAVQRQLFEVTTAVRLDAFDQDA